MDIVLTVDEYKFVLTTPRAPVPAANTAQAVRDAHRRWHKANEMAKCYMLASMSTVLRHQHAAMATAADIMQNLTKSAPSFQQFKLNFEMNKRNYTLAELLTELQSEDLMNQAKAAMVTRRLYDGEIEVQLGDATKVAVVAVGGVY
ncbi:uncharacterized protein LOC125189823 [Salvia hispanica]|uniref:uncharacterized protein LOC125189823 n=1 Tax=Salvia hispanica TaxID=49212 RepID=UPI002009D386|nr:uncharacterized protein LOC125189823 [Salvia hispanica]